MRDHSHVWQLRKRVDEAVSNPVAEIFRIGIFAGVDERQNCHGVYRAAACTAEIEVRYGRCATTNKPAAATTMLRFLTLIALVHCPSLAVGPAADSITVS